MILAGCKGCAIVDALDSQCCTIVRLRDATGHKPRRVARLIDRKKGHAGYRTFGTAGASDRAFQGQSNQQLRGSAGNTAHDWELMLQLTFCTAKIKRITSS